MSAHHLLPRFNAWTLPYILLIPGIITLGANHDGWQEKLPRGVVKEIMLERILLVTNFSGIERDVVSCLYESDVILFSISICNLLLGLSFLNVQIELENKIIS